jgi:hypothetical protein
MNTETPQLSISGVFDAPRELVYLPASRQIVAAEA